MHIKNVTNSNILVLANLFLSHAIDIAITNVPSGIKYFIQPKIPPRIGLRCLPILPVFPYIKTANKRLSIISIATFILFFELFLELFLFLLPGFLPLFANLHLHMYKFIYT